MFKLVSSLSLVSDILGRALSILTGSYDGGWSRGSATKSVTGRTESGESATIIVGYCATQAIMEAISRWSQEYLSYGHPESVTLNTLTDDGKKIAGFTEAGQALFNDACRVLSIPLGWKENNYGRSNSTGLVQGFNDAHERTQGEVANLFRFGINLIEYAGIFAQAEPVVVGAGEPAAESSSDDSDSESD